MTTFFSFGFLGIFVELCSIICSVAGEPCLEEWTSRAELYDMLHERVGSDHFSNL